MRRHRRVGPVAHTGPRCALHCAQGSVPAPFSALFTFLCSVHIWPSPAHTGPLHCAQGPVPAPFSAQLCAHLAQPCAHRCSAHTGPALHTECPAASSLAGRPARSLLDHKRFERIDGRLDGIDGRLDDIDGRLDGIDGRLNGIDGRLDGIDTCVKKILKELESVTKYLKSVDKYQKFAFLTYRWVKALAVSSSVTSLLLTGLIKILTSARVFQIDLISLVGAVFAICFGTTFTSFGDEKSADLGAI